MKDKIKRAGILAVKHTYKEYREGRIPIALGKPGMLALIYDRIAKFMSNRASIDTLELASLAICVLVSFEEEKEREYSRPNPNPAQETEKNPEISLDRADQTPRNPPIPNYEQPDTALIADLNRPLDELSTGI